ncbi:MAG: CalY family protein, partial [Carnobacterium alterfunditum]
MKKTSANNRRKKLPLLLGALLVISVAAYGTRAYFSDSTKQQANIELELGNVEITTEETAWTSKSSNTESELFTLENGTQKYTSLTNVKPGDAFTRKYTIKNTGSLKVEVGINYTGKYSALSDGNYDATNKKFTVKDGPFLISIAGLENNFKLAANAFTTYDITVAVDENASNELYNNKDGN